ncbi:MAG: RagB/SusD family nutrient uptake outer membrane protein [Mangrovibacterium sp.]
MNNRFKKIILAVVALISLNSCEDYLEKFPLDKPSDATFYSTESELNLAINGVYSDLYFHPANSTQLNLLLDCVSDIGWDRDANSALQLAARGLQNPTQEFFSDTWFQYYGTISKCNLLLANMHKAKEVTNEQVYKRIEGEARFFRAYSYQMLTSLFGDVPLLTEPQSDVTEKPAATPAKEVVPFILSELETAAGLLPVVYTGDDTGRAASGTALAMKARAALFDSNWAVAADACKRIIDSKAYSLVPDYNALFGYPGENSKESLLEVQYSRVNARTHATPVALLSRMGAGYSNKVPSQSLVDSYYCTDGLPINVSPLYNGADPFKNRDPRLAATVVVPGSVFAGYQFETHPDSLKCWDYNVTPAVRRKNQDATNPYATFSGYCWRKYTAESKEYIKETEMNIILIRYAEVLLMYAEAKNELNQMDQSAYDAFNLVRKRVSMPVVENKSQAEMRKLVRQERKVELAMEGLRFFDIRRWKLAERVMVGSLYGRPLKDYKATYVPTFDEDGMPHYDAYAGKLRNFDQRAFDVSRDYLWPIPQKELDINKNLEQNPGY